MPLTNPVELKFPPKHQGHDSDALLSHDLIVKAARITHDSFTGNGTIQLFNVPQNTLILELILDIVGAWGGSQTFTLGDGSDTDRFMDNTIAGPNTVGFKSSKQDDSQPGAGGHVYTADDTIDIVGTGTPTAGTADIYLRYVPFADDRRLLPGQ